MNYPSRLVEDAVNELSRLPGIGKKTALRLALFLLREDEQVSQSIAEALVKMRTQTVYCQRCYNLSDSPVCSICSDRNRDHSLLCVVESCSDVLALENTGQYKGMYHVLGGVISPIDGIGPSELKIEELTQRLPESDVKEVILALNSTMEAETTAFYITRKLQPFQLKISTIARGVPVGSELEYTDEVTLGRSILQRVKYQ